MIWASYFILLSKIIDSADLDQLAKCLMNICNYRGTTCLMVHEMIGEEFLASQETTIMRGNSITTKNIFCRTLNRTALRCV